MAVIKNSPVGLVITQEVRVGWAWSKRVWLRLRGEGNVVGGVVDGCGMNLQGLQWKLIRTL